MFLSRFETKLILKLTWINWCRLKIYLISDFIVYIGFLN